jgi:hypothetical protein
LPATADSSEAQLVASVSSISLPRLMPSPVAVAPVAAEARFAGISTWRRLTIPGFNSTETRFIP